MSLREKILKGKEYTKTIHLSALDEDVVIKPLTSAQFEQLLDDLEKHQINIQDEEGLKKSLYKNIAAMRMVCKLGLADPEEVALVDDIIGGEAVSEIGLAILAITNTSSEEMKDFFRTPETKT